MGCGQGVVCVCVCVGCGEKGRSLWKAYQKAVVWGKRDGERGPFRVGLVGVARVVF